MKTIRWRLALSAVAVSVVALLTSGPVSAQISTCRSDPTLTLSNGAQLTLYEDIADVPTDVTGIHYLVNLPAGVTVTSIDYSGAIDSSLQSVSVVSDDPPSTVDAFTFVSTGTANIPVAAFASVSAGGKQTPSIHVNGHSAQILHSHLHF